jgi:hypothetical protein
MSLDMRPDHGRAHKRMASHSLRVAESLAPGSTPVYKQGWLTKQGGSSGGFLARKNWNRRWFVLDSSGISYYKVK